MKEKQLTNIINESIKKVLSEKNYMRGAEDASTLEGNIEKAIRLLEATKNVWKKVGQYDELRGQASGMYAQIMKSLSDAQHNMKMYLYDTYEMMEYGAFSDENDNWKKPEDFPATQGKLYR